MQDLSKGTNYESASHSLLPSLHDYKVAQWGTFVLLVWWQPWRGTDVAIYAARRDGAGWSAPVKMADGAEADWNPVLFYRGDGTLLLFYKEGQQIAQGHQVHISYTFDRKNIAAVSLEAGKLWAWSEDNASMGYKLLLLLKTPVSSNFSLQEWLHKAASCVAVRVTQLFFCRYSVHW